MAGNRIAKGKSHVLLSWPSVGGIIGFGDEENCSVLQPRAQSPMYAASLAVVHLFCVVLTKSGSIVLEWCAQGRRTTRGLCRQPLKLIRIGDGHAGTLDGDPLIPAELAEKPCDCLS